MAKKGLATKRVTNKKVWSDGKRFTVAQGQLSRPRGRPIAGASALFKVVAEKLPFDSLNGVSRHLATLGIPPNGVYAAHDSMGYARYVGRGAIFTRLKLHKKAHAAELAYFSFYVVADKGHERELETLVIRAAGPQLQFNARKRRVDIAPGNVGDFEPGTFFYERQRKRGPLHKKAR